MKTKEKWKSVYHLHHYNWENKTLLEVETAVDWIAEEVRTPGVREHVKDI